MLNVPEFPSRRLLCRARNDLGRRSNASSALRAMILAPLLDAPPAIALHAMAAITAFALGIVQFAAPKGTIPHRTVGWIWVGLMLAVALSSFLIHHIRLWGPWPLGGPARVDHGGGEALVSRLRHERDRGAGAARCARRPQAGASAHPLFDA